MKNSSRQKWNLKFSISQENEYTAYPNIRDRMRLVLREMKVDGTNCLHKRTGEISYSHLNSIPESSRTNRSNHTKKEGMTTNDPIAEL